MTIPKHTTYVSVVGEPYLDRAAAFKASKIDTTIEWSTFALARGAEKYFGKTELYGLVFSGALKRPDGWSKPDARGCSRPTKTKAGLEELAAIKALSKAPNPWSVFPEYEIPFSLNYEGPGEDHGNGCACNLWEPQILWIGEAFFGLICDVSSAVRDDLIAHPGRRFGNNVDTWILPAGLQRITEAEWEFAVAKYNLVAERAKIVA